MKIDTLRDLWQSHEFSKRPRARCSYQSGEAHLPYFLVSVGISSFLSDYWPFVGCG
jgi:hypothetical protein